jgi:hypothetical protein
MNQSLEQSINQPRRTLHLLYHELRPGGSRYSYVLDTKEFERHLQMFTRIGENKDSSLFPEVTFDDGHISNFEYALPLLQEYGLQAHFFITAGWTGNKAGYMDWQELRSLHDAGQIIGAHGWSHVLLTHCSTEELRKELEGAKRALEDKLGTVIETISLPGGRYNRRVLAACQAAGYTSVYTSIPRAENLPLGAMIGRLNVRGDMKLEWIADILQQKGGLLSGLERQYQVKAAAKAILGDQLYERLWAVLNRKADEATANEDSPHYQ